MLDNLFNEFLALSDRLRAGYSISLSIKRDGWETIISSIASNIPELYHVIYNKVQGTERGVQQQELMDFIPGYRLIHINELADEKRYVDEILKDCTNLETEMILPLLGNYSSDYICYIKTKEGKECIGHIMHDSLDVIIMHLSIDKFFETICEFYRNEVYFLDEDGYLDYDFEKQAEIAMELNVDVDFW